MRLNLVYPMINQLSLKEKKELKEYLDKSIEHDEYMKIPEIFRSYNRIIIETLLLLSDNWIVEKLYAGRGFQNYQLIFYDNVDNIPKRDLKSDIYSWVYKIEKVQEGTSKDIETFKNELKYELSSSYPILFVKKNRSIDINIKALSEFIFDDILNVCMQDVLMQDTMNDKKFKYIKSQQRRFIQKKYKL